MIEVKDSYFMWQLVTPIDSGPFWYTVNCDLIRSTDQLTYFIFEDRGHILCMYLSAVIGDYSNQNSFGYCE